MRNGRDDVAALPSLYWVSIFEPVFEPLSKCELVEYFARIIKKKPETIEISGF